MDLSRLSCSIKKAVPVEGQSTFAYEVEVQRDSLIWQVSKRFSEFDRLFSDLEAKGYASLPQLPSKTLFGKPTDDGDINARRLGLQAVLHELLCRPDTRTSEPVLSFLQFQERTKKNAVFPIKPEAPSWACIPENGGLAVSCCAVDLSDPSRILLAVTWEDKSVLSRMGRMWTLIEPEELGAFAVFALPLSVVEAEREKGKNNQEGQDKSKEEVPGKKTTAWKRIFHSPSPVKLRCVAMHEPSHQVFVGTEDGKVLTYRVEEDKEDVTKSIVLQGGEIPDLHTAPLLCLHIGPKRGKMLSASLDGAIRVMEVPEKTVFSGGRLTKRLGGGTLTAAFMDDVEDRVLLGSSLQDVLIYDVSCNPPTLIHSFNLAQQASGSVPRSGPCTHISLAPKLDGGVALFAHGQALTLYGLERKGKEKRMPRMATLVCPQTKNGGGAITGVAVDEISRQIFVALESGGILCLSLGASRALWGVVGHTNGGVTFLSSARISSECLPVSSSPKHGFAFLSGGQDGYVNFWDTPKPSDLRFWDPQKSLVAAPPQPSETAEQHGEAAGGGSEPPPLPYAPFPSTPSPPTQAQQVGGQMGAGAEGGGDDDWQEEALADFTSSAVPVSGAYGADPLLLDASTHASNSLNGSGWGHQAQSAGGPGIAGGVFEGGAGAENGYSDLPSASASTPAYPSEGFGGKGGGGLGRGPGKGSRRRGLRKFGEAVGESSDSDDSDGADDLRTAL
uniref:PX domain-containing protein n=1 Tax=Chromera velia CCMP2878 TaxID=1169474 RepID=A0A0G4HBM9_9ALVE|eukprot:Cvel_6244.t1-p1 / transcript=Cvel_6244.t1 / gene=Cvel_6244 / organism=Chromera_velia_CCMP2878 / gene_product=hypothetical protein / transcript_product=hypothetical protein / location=Cvel_scaffold302:53114-56129(+) / protein_length=729 / sequence_SO=supercontig / SO=protein_coding / is_pseudo=false